MGADGKQPKYLWLAEQIRKPILNGALTPGTRLPSRTRLARTYRVSEQISRTALRLLVTEGLRRLEARGCPFVMVIGHPTYYPRFGFVPASRHGITCEWDVPDEAFMILVLQPALPPGISGLARYRKEFAMES